MEIHVKIQQWKFTSKSIFIDPDYKYTPPTWRKNGKSSMRKPNRLILEPAMKPNTLGRPYDALAPERLSYKDGKMVPENLLIYLRYGDGTHEWLPLRRLIPSSRAVVAVHREVLFNDIEWMWMGGMMTRAERNDFRMCFDYLVKKKFPPLTEPICYCSGLYRLVHNGPVAAIAAELDTDVDTFVEMNGSVKVGDVLRKDMESMGLSCTEEMLEEFDASPQLYSQA